MNLKLLILDRLAMNAIMPPTGNYETMVAVQNIKNKVDIGDEEKRLTSLKIDQASGNVQWNRAADSPHDFTFNEKETEIIKTALKTLNDSNHLVQEHLGLYKAVMLDAEPATVH